MKTQSNILFLKSLPIANKIKMSHANRMLNYLLSHHRNDGFKMVHATKHSFIQLQDPAYILHNLELVLKDIDREI